MTANFSAYYRTGCTTMISPKNLRFALSKVPDEWTTQKDLAFVQLDNALADHSDGTTPDLMCHDF